MFSERFVLLSQTPPDGHFPAQLRLSPRPRLIACGHPSPPPAGCRLPVHRVAAALTRPAERLPPAAPWEPAPARGHATDKPPSFPNAWDPAPWPPGRTPPGRSVTAAVQGAHGKSRRALSSGGRRRANARPTVRLGRPRRGAWGRLQVDAPAAGPIAGPLQGKRWRTLTPRSGSGPGRRGADEQPQSVGLAGSAQRPPPSAARVCGTPAGVLTALPPSLCTCSEGFGRYVLPKSPSPWPSRPRPDLPSLTPVSPDVPDGSGLTRTSVQRLGPEAPGF